MTDLLTEIMSDPPATGRPGALRVRPSHPAFQSGPDADPLTVRLLFLLRTYPGLVDCRPDDVAGLDTPAKNRFVEQLDAALGLNAPAPAAISGHS